MRAEGYGLLVTDAYRPWYATKMFWDATPPEDHNFVADPSQGSRHNRGCAVDLTLYTLADGQRQVEGLETAWSGPVTALYVVDAGALAFVVSSGHRAAVDQGHRAYGHVTVRERSTRLLQGEAQYAAVVDHQGRIDGVLSVEIISEFLKSPKAKTEEHGAVERPHG